jgi:hypothetical protein
VELYNAPVRRMVIAEHLEQTILLQLMYLAQK